MWNVYIVECRDSKLYTGVTDDLERRIQQHNSGNGCRFTKYRYPVKLLYVEQYELKSDCLKREAEVKGWSRDKKSMLFRK